MKWPISLVWRLAVLLVAGGVALAGPPDPPWFARAWQSDEGLPDNTVVGVDQTPDGFLWVATQGGLVRFDGLRFQQIPAVTTAGTPTGLIQALLCDSRGRLWVAKDRRTVLCLEHDRVRVYNPDPAVPSAETRMLAEDSEGGIWVSYIGGDLVRIKDGQARSYTGEQGLPGGNTCQLATDARGQLWFSQGGWLGVFREGKFLQLVGLRAQRITPARSGGIWVCTGPQLYHYREGQPLRKVGELPSLRPNVNPTVLYEDRSGRLWIGTREAGLFSYDGTGFTHVITSHQEILSLKEDREGNLWAGTQGGGLNLLKPRTVELLATDPDIPFEAVRSLCQDRAGNLWTVSEGGVVSRDTGSGWAPLTAKDGWSVSYAQCVAPDDSGGIWIGTQYKGLHHWQNGAVVTRLARTNGLGGDYISALATERTGAVWFGTESVDAQQHALQCWRQGELMNLELPPRSGPVVAIVVDSAGDGWAATSIGLLLRWHEGRLTDETRRTLVAPEPIRCLLARPDRSLWIGYGGGGVGRLKGERFTHYRTDEGLHDDYISQMVPDGGGRLWFAGNGGIFFVREKELDDLAEGRALRIRSVVYGQSEGLPRLQASHSGWPGALRGRDGRLWIPMQSGLAVVHAAGFKESPAAPPVVLERVVVNGATVAAYGAGDSPPGVLSLATLDAGVEPPVLRLAPGRRQVEFSFTALSLVMPETIGFKYRLEGLEPDWLDGGAQRTVTYPQLPPGEYRFEVKACNRDGVWSDRAASLALTAERYWWQTTWFQVAGPVTACGLLAGGALVALRRRHRRQIERLELLQATERERARIA